MKGRCQGMGTGILELKDNKLYFSRENVRKVHWISSAAVLREEQEFFIPLIKSKRNISEEINMLRAEVWIAANSRH